ncbi:MAG TPA: hypothetical protein VKE42_09155, partial [Candidatus Cybelea sp.]|nr:hypothetical protein [Candidatus Cybelea sp.]
DVHGGLQRRHEDLVMNGVYRDGALVRVRVVSYAINGRRAGASDVAGVEQSWNHPKPSEVFAAPFDPRNFEAYQYRSVGDAAIAFSSGVRDAGHGSGSFTYDARGNVVSYTFVPNSLPPHAKSGTIADQRAEVLPGYWASTQETQQYKGSYGPFAASGAIEVTYSDFRRVSNLDSALTSL